MIIYRYQDFNKRSFIHKNRDYVSSEMLITNSRKHIYDSFIFGASTALAFTPSIWRDYIKTDNLCYTFDASGEYIDGIWSKVKYLDANGYKINNALIILESNTFDQFVNDVPIFMKHPRVYPSSLLYFHYSSFLSFMELKFQVAIITHLITGKFYPFMNEILVSSNYEYDTITNEFYNIGLWDEIKNDSVGFYEKRANTFPHVTGKYTEGMSQITDQHRVMLEEIKVIFDKQWTAYRIIISPALNQLSFNRDDLSVIKEIFGEEFVFDFTGINKFTENKADYTDATHFKRYLARRMLEIVYNTAPAELFP